MIPILSKWYMVELTNLHLYGNIYGDPDYNNGEEIQTGPVVEINVEKNLLYTKTKTYKLGPPDTVWFAEYQRQNK